MKRHLFHALVIEPLEARIAPAFAAVLELSGLTGPDGFQIDGEAGDLFGWSVSAAGDVNGDGYDDVFIAAPRVNGAYSGSTYVVFGHGGVFSATFDVSSLNGMNGFKINGKSARSVSTAGDVNGDGFHDLLIGAHVGFSENGVGSGVTYVVFGHGGAFAPTLEFPSRNGVAGFKINGEAKLDLSGSAVSAAGDINGDGFDDVLIGAHNADANAYNSGASYVVFGHGGDFAPTLELSGLTGANGFKINGENTVHGRFGTAVSTAGDVNGDGFDDLIISAFWSRPNSYHAGSSYVVFGHGGPFAATLEASSLTGVNGFKIHGEAERDWAGRAVSTAGDVNGDGFDDLLIGAYGADGAEPNGDFAGASYVVFGHDGAFGSTLELSGLTGANGFKINGEAGGGRAGFAVSDAGDVNGDGFDDIVIGAPWTRLNGEVFGDSSGASYVVFGHGGDFGRVLELSSLTGTNGFQINGEHSGGYLGWSVSAAGDLNADGVDDLIIGAPGALNYRGSAYVIFGQGPSTLAIGDASASEGNTGAALISFPVTLSAMSTQTVSVLVSTIDGTATAGLDYVAVTSQFVQFAPGETSKTVTVSALGDTIVEPNETFTVVLSHSRNAAISDGSGLGTIRNDDAPPRPPVTLSADAKKATFIDLDGDFVKVKTNKGAFTQQDFSLVASGVGGQLQLLDLANDTAFNGANITVVAKPRSDGTGDGFVNLGHFDATGVSLGAVIVDGDLGQIDARNAAQLIADSLGVAEGTQAPGTTEPFRSVLGSVVDGGGLGELRIAGTMRGTLEVFDDIGIVTIGGGLGIGGSSGALGLIRAGGDIGSVAIGGSVLAGLDQVDPSGIRAGGTLGLVTIGLDFGGPQIAGKAAVISALGRLNPTFPGAPNAIASVVIGRDVVNAGILAGYDPTLVAANSDASIGAVKVRRDWSASDLVAGIADVTADGFGRNDTLISGGNAAVLARVGSVTITGVATGSISPTSDHYGIIAESIGRVKINNLVFPLTAGKDNLLLDPVTNDFRLVEV